MWQWCYHSCFLFICFFVHIKSNNPDINIPVYLSIRAIIRSPLRTVDIIIPVCLSIYLRRWNPARAGSVRVSEVGSEYSYVSPSNLTFHHKTTGGDLENSWWRFLSDLGSLRWWLLLWLVRRGPCQCGFIKRHFHFLKFTGMKILGWLWFWGCSWMLLIELITFMLSIWSPDTLDS